MQIELELKATYQAPGLTDDDAPELEFGWLRREMGKLLGGSSQMHITLKFKGKDGEWKTLRG